MYYRNVIVAMIMMFILGFSSVTFAGTMDDMAFNGARNNDVDMIEKGLQYGANINYIHNGDTPLSVAVGKDNADLVRYLLSKGASPNIKIGDMPIIIATRHDNLEIIDILVQSGADVNTSVVKDGIYHMSGDTPLIIAAGRPNPSPEIVEYLISKNAKINQASNYGVTPLMKVAKKEPYSSNEVIESKLKIASILINNSADTKRLNYWRQTALNIAINSNFKEMIDLLLPISPK